MTSALEALGEQRLRDSIAGQGERLAGQARTGPAPNKEAGSFLTNQMLTLTLGFGWFGRRPDPLDQVGLWLPKYKHDCDA